MTIKQLIEYYCFQVLDPSESLPQRCCRACFETINRFAAFCHKISEKQIELLKQVDPNSKNDYEAESQGTVRESHQRSSSAESTSIIIDDEEEETPASRLLKDSAKRINENNKRNRWIVIPPEQKREPEVSVARARLEELTTHNRRKVIDGDNMEYIHNTEGIKNTETSRAKSVAALSRAKDKPAAIHLEPPSACSSEKDIELNEKAVPEARADENPTSELELLLGSSSGQEQGKEVFPNRNSCGMDSVSSLMQMVTLLIYLICFLALCEDAARDRPHL